jgi:hypothetical protein
MHIDNEPRSRGRRPLLPAAYISQLNRLQPFDLGCMDQICDGCGAKHWKAELPSDSISSNIYWNSCCKAGEVKVDLLKEPPALTPKNITSGKTILATIC